METLFEPCPDLECPLYSICLGDDNDDWTCSCIQGFEMVGVECLDIGLLYTYFSEIEFLVKMNVNGKTFVQRRQTA